jgi:hypothetical protein
MEPAIANIATNLFCIRGSPGGFKCTVMPKLLDGCCQVVSRREKGFEIHLVRLDVQDFDWRRLSSRRDPHLIDAGRSW